MPTVEQRGRELWVLMPKDIAKALDVDEGDALSFEMLDTELAGIRKTHTMPPAEMAVLKKINSIRFAERTKDKLRSVLTDDDQKVLGKLVKKGAVSFYEQGKYKERGVYSISKDYYTFLTTGKKPAGSKIEKVFGKRKYLVTNSKEDARDVLLQLENEVKNGNVVSVMGFDKKVYITTRDVLESVGGKITAALGNGEMGLGELVGVCGEEDELVKTVLEVLRESGDVFERRDGVYALV